MIKATNYTSINNETIILTLKFIRIIVLLCLASIIIDAYGPDILSDLDLMSGNNPDYDEWMKYYSNLGGAPSNYPNWPGQPNNPGNNSGHISGLIQQNDNFDGQNDDTTTQNDNTATTVTDLMEPSEEEKEKALHEWMHKKLDNHRISKAGTNPYDTSMGNEFTGAEHEYVCQKIFDHEQKTGERPGLRWVDMIVGSYPDRRYAGPVSRNLLAVVFANKKKV